MKIADENNDEVDDEPSLPENKQLSITRVESTAWIEREELTTWIWFSFSCGE